MNEKSPLLSSHLPARLIPEKVAEILGFSPYEISVLMKTGLLKPLGRPAPNAHKYFCAVEVVELSYNREWLDKATRVISRHWRDKNQREKEQKLAASPV
jgi:hypothetical protein